MCSKVGFSIYELTPPTSWNITRVKVKLCTKRRIILSESGLERRADLCYSLVFIEPNVFVWESINRWIVHNWDLSLSVWIRRIVRRQLLHLTSAL